VAIKVNLFWKIQMIRTYRELRNLETLEERFEYLSLSSRVGDSTFGFDRWMNQRFYTSREWRTVRDEVIVRDNGCDLGVPEYEIHNRLVIHHMNPMTIEDFVHGSDDILNPDYLITTCHQTHNGIHYGDNRQLPRRLIVRAAGDTKLW
jgi:hypothetical protein